MIDFLSSININCIKANTLSGTTICAASLCTSTSSSSPIVCATSCVRSPLISGTTMCASTCLQLNGPIKTTTTITDSLNSASSPIVQGNGWWALRTGTDYSINFDTYNSGVAKNVLNILQDGVTSVNGSFNIYQGNDLRIIANTASTDTGDIVFYTGNSTASGAEFSRIWIESTTNCLLYRSRLDGLVSRCVFHTGNISQATVGSANNSTCAGGLIVETGRNNVANRIVRTDGSGYLQVGYINSNNGNEGNASCPPRIWGTNGSDDYLRTFLTSSLCVNLAVCSTCVISTNSLSVNSTTSAVSVTYANNVKLSTQTNGVCITGCGFSTDFIASSDRRLKKDITPISNALSIVENLCGVCYRMCDDVNNENRVGLIAQEVQLVLPEIVSHSKPDENDEKYGITDDKLGLKYDKLTAVLIEAIKEQQQQINELKDKINLMNSKF
jgi:hypothetical protein